MANIKTKLKKEEYKSKFLTLFTLRSFLLNCIYSDETFLEDLNLDLKLTPSGSRLAKHLKKKLSLSDNAITFLLLTDLYMEDLYIDIDKSDVDKVVLKLSSLVKDRKILFPWIYRRELYDKYFDEFELQQNHLFFNDVIKLLDNTFQGVFQSENLICGPFGLLKSKVRRFLPPTLDVLLWHCPDPSCPTFHDVKLHNSNQNLIVRGLEEIGEYNSDKSPLDVRTLIDAITEDISDHHNPNSLRELPSLIANTFNDAELKKILKCIIETEKDIISVFVKKGKPEDILNKLSIAECLQLILIVDDTMILSCIEKLIDSGQIVIPVTETRDTNVKYEKHRDLILQCNKLGIRAYSNWTNESSARLKHVIRSIHGDSPYREQLEWNLKKYNDYPSLNQKLEKYISETNPNEVIKSCILSGPVQLGKAIKLIPGFFNIPMDEESEQAIIDKIAWKVGYDIKLYPENLAKFWRNFEQIEKSVARSNKYNEDDKDQIRSAAVNTFVSLEEILEQALSFITWALMSDHYANTQFKYVYEDAREFMCTVLNNFEFTPGEFLKFDHSGKNTLFPLVQGFGALLKFCDETIENEAKYKRDVLQFPSFYQSDPLRYFPFEHTRFVLDILPNHYTAIKGELQLITSEFGKGDVLGIRNRLQHKRDNFPTQDEIQKALDSIKSIVSLLVNRSIYPNIFLFRSTSIDNHGRRFTTFSDYRGKEILLTINTELFGSGLPTHDKPLTFLGSCTFGLTNLPVHFEYMEKSDYQSYWKNYPRKKKRT